VTAADATNGQVDAAADVVATEITTPITTNLVTPVATVAPPALTIASGNNQVLSINTTSAPLVVLLTNNGLPVANATINWSTPSNATLASATSTTNAAGKATNTVTLHQAGAASVSASSSAPAAGPVTFALNGGLSSLNGLTPPEIEIANALDHACPALAGLTTLTPAEQDLLAQCQALASAAGQNPDQVANALNQMLPHDALLQTNASILVAGAQFDNIKARLAALRSGSGGDHFGGLAFSSPEGVLPLGKLGETALGFDGKPAEKKAEVGGGFDRWGFFASGTFGDGSANARAETPGYGFHSGGVTAGVDYRANDHMIVGVSAGYANYSSNVDVVGGGLDTRGWSLSAYASFFRQDNWYVDGVLTWGHNDYDINRRIIYTLTTNTGTDSVNQTATSSSSGTTLAGALTIGRDFSKGPWSFGPYLRGTWTRTDFGSYQENMVSSQTGSGLGLAVQSRSMKDVSSVLGAKVNYASSQSWGVLMPHAEVEWEHDFENNPDSITAHFLQDPTSTPFQLGGDSIDTDFFRLGLGLSFQFAHGRSGFIYYEKILGLSGITQNNIALGFRMEF
jgi:outer membrane autotransporter protein